MPFPDPATHDHPPIAKTVVWRHPCDCASASRPLKPGEEPEHRFDVDGAPFPWYITEPPAGCSILRHGELYLVALEIFPIEAGGNHDIFDITLSYWRRQPRIGDTPFPWAIADGTIVANVREGDFPMLRLTMLAENVDADYPIPELDMWNARSPQEAYLEAAERRKSLPPERAAVGAAIDQAERERERRRPTASRHGNQCATPDCILDAGHPDHHESQQGASWRTYSPGVVEDPHA